MESVKVKKVDFERRWEELNYVWDLCPGLANYKTEIQSMCRLCYIFGSNDQWFDDN